MNSHAKALTFTPEETCVFSRRAVHPEVPKILQIVAYRLVSLDSFARV